VLKDDTPSALTQTGGCAFRSRCQYAIPACAEAVPTPRAVGPNHSAACIRDDLALDPGRRLDHSFAIGKSRMTCAESLRTTMAVTIWGR